MEVGKTNGAAPSNKRPRLRSQHSPRKRLRLDEPKPAPTTSPAYGITTKPSIQSYSNKNKFIYGNYNRYYGYRHTEKCSDDVRLKAFEGYRDLFDAKAILDVGCNDGSVTIAIAKKFPIKSITGIDIDRNLVGAAQKRLARETLGCDTDEPAADQPDTLSLVKFKQSNYVLNSDDLLELEEPQFDAILCLSVTKWMHLNFGDSGLKRAFKRFYRQLNENGVLILEAQNWKSYKRRKSLTPQINAHFRDIRLRPDQFHEYLLSEAVGFSSSFMITLPEQHPIDGFKRPIIAYRKGKSP